MIDNYPEKITVNELIEFLKQFPPDMRVVTHGKRKGFHNILVPEIRTVYRDEEAMSEYEGEYDVGEIPGQKPIEVVVIFRDNGWD
ncbi:MAG: hypothetical protein JW881_04520 [Spirochaetales bacterium]|nr:hypothetical protein [Spirochaetales bacterium]